MKKNAKKKPEAAPAAVEVMDTTLRDGEQTHGVAFNAGEKLAIATLLLERVCVDRIEVASARVSDGEGKAVGLIADWARGKGLLDRVEVLGFCDVNKSADWIGGNGGRVMNLLTKGSYRHLTGQLGKTPEEHLRDVRKTLEYCERRGIACNCYPEDWSGGMLEENGYARWFIGELVQLGFRRIMLPDTLGRFWPEQVRRFVGELAERYPRAHFDFHAHNDYGLATANALAAVAGGARGVHVTVNGLGERAGNAPLDEVAVGLRDILERTPRVAEGELTAASRMVEAFSGRRVAANKPVSGQAVFTQTAGIHADGDKKGNLYVTGLTPERFGRTRTYALGKHAGKASLEMNLRRLGVELPPEQQQAVLRKVVELGDQKKTVTPEDLPFIIAGVVNAPGERAIRVAECLVSTSLALSPVAAVKVVYRGREHEASAAGDGGYDAFMKALRLILERLGLGMPALLDYEVRIPPGGRTDALVETTISWEGNLVTRGLHTDQLKAAVLATEHMLNIVHGKK